jgi:hypothetical protein
MFVVGLILVTLTLWGSVVEFGENEASEGALPLLSLWWLFIPLAAVLMIAGAVMLFGGRGDKALPPEATAPTAPVEEQDGKV